VAVSDVVVVGAGIVGASIAYHLALAGVSVTLVDKGVISGGATAESFGWIGGPGGGDVPDASTPLRAAALDAYPRLEAELPGVRVRWTGSVSWRQREPSASGPLAPGERLLGEAELRELEPALREAPAHALFRSQDGAVDPVAVTEALVAGARQRGAKVVPGTVVTGVRMSGGRAAGVLTPAGVIAAGAVVLAAGVDVPALTAVLGVPLPVACSPALLARVEAPPGLVRTVVDAPALEVREAAPGLLLLPLAHQGESTRAELARAGAAALGRLRSTFTGADGARLLDVRTGPRPLPGGREDGLPLIGPLPGADGVHVAVLHSAVTLGPAVGHLLALELTTGRPAPELAGLRPDRP
jgi:glycine/D-amino acid oxidase-like deaminating enzyme